MKKVYFLFLLLSFVIFYGCKTQGKDLDNIGKDNVGQNQGNNNGSITKQDSTLKKLVIKQGSQTLQEFTKPVREKLSIRLVETVNSANSIIIEAITERDDAQVWFDGKVENSKTKTYTGFTANILIEVKQGNSSTRYKIELKKPIIPEPPNYTVKCNVTDSIGGSNIDDVEIKAFEKGVSEAVETKTTDGNGDAYFTLPANKYYNFVLSKKGRAASRVENMYLRENKKEFLPIVMQEWAVGSARIVPEIELIEVGTAGNFVPIEEAYTMNFSTLSDDTRIYITVKSSAGQIIPERKEDTKMCGFIANIDSPVSSNSGGVIFPTSIKGVNNETIQIDSSGATTQKFALKPRRLSCNNGDHVLYLILYDTAGNRLERHVRLNVINSHLKEEENTQNEVRSLQVSSKRYYRSLNAFGMPYEAGSCTSNLVEFMFRLKSRENVARVDILRRPYQKDNITEGWQTVYTRCYDEAFSGDRKGYIVLHDDSGTLKESAVYQYKLQIYTEKGKIMSNVATLRIMEAFNIQLFSPKYGEAIQRESVKEQAFSFTLSNSSLWDKEKADYFFFDILVVRDYCKSFGSTTDTGVCFASKVKYDFRSNGDDALYVGKLNQNRTKFSWEKHKSLSTKDYSLTDLLIYNNDKITITPAFMSEKGFSFADKALTYTVNEPGMYYWDVQDFGLDPLAFVTKDGVDDGSAYFVKEYPYLDAKTGAEISGTSKSSSICNLNRVGGAINGRSLFIVK